MQNGRKERVKIRTNHALYTGYLFIPERRNRFSDVINEQTLVFVNLTDVTLDKNVEMIEHVSINKRFIESVRKA